MTAPPRAPEDFDRHVDDYAAKIMAGLSLVGEEPEYFARGRVDFLREWWAGQVRSEPARIVDYGCGLGATAALLAERFPGSRVLGLDPSPRSVEAASRRWAGDRVRFEVATGDAADGEPADLVYLNGVVHHVLPADRPRLFADLAARVSPGGIVALFENNPWNPGTRWVMSRVVFDRDAVTLAAPEARDWLRRAGLAPLSTTYLFYFPRILRALRPLERPLRRLPLGGQYAVLAAAP